MKIIREYDSFYQVPQDLLLLKPLLASAAKKVYDNWQQEDGYDEQYGAGGICDDIAEAFCNVIQDNTSYQCQTIYNEHDCHTAAYAWSSKEECYQIDINPYYYEKGFGYTWKKIEGRDFPETVVIIEPTNYELVFGETDEELFENRYWFTNELEKFIKTREDFRLWSKRVYILYQ